MQLITFISAATAMAATASASISDVVRSAITLNEECNTEMPYARVINRCDYDVHLWSVLKGTGCPSDGMVTLKTGEIYSENYHNSTDSTGVSIKISKTDQCKENDIVQLEYYLDYGAYQGNYLDVSYVDCQADDCPTKQEGYYLVAGNQTGAAKASADNTWCPILSCDDPASCAKCSYILPDDTQTKTCDLKSNMDFYMCGGEAPTEDYDNAPVVSAPAASSAAPSKVESSTPIASSSAAESSTPATSSVDGGYKVKAAAVTPAPAANNDYPQRVKTEVVYVTAYQVVNEKRHVHGHARRHQAFQA